MAQTLTILDPTSLLGRPIADRVAELLPGVRRTLLHTDENPEHLIAEVGGEASLVAPLLDPEELAGTRVVLLTSRPPEAFAARLLAWLEANPSVALLDATQPGLAPEASQVVGFLSSPRSAGWYQLPDPSLAGPLRVLRALAPLGPRAASLTLLAPASTFGAAALEELASQGAARLSGGVPAKPQHLPDVLAFDVTPAAAPRLRGIEHQLEALFPGLERALQVLEVGVFHGHMASISVECREPARLDRVRSMLRDAPGLRLPRGRERVRTSDAVGAEEAVCAEVRAVGSTVSLLVLADGLRLGVVEAAVDSLESLMAS